MKFKNKLQLGVFFVSMLMLTACGGGGGSTAPNLVTPPGDIYLGVHRCHA
jgi:hypothetical protein